MSTRIRLSRKKAAKHPGLRWEKVSEFLIFAEVSGLTSIQRIAYFAYDSFSKVTLAGHREYFAMTGVFDHDERVAALRAIGAHEQAELLVAARRAVELAASLAPEQYENRFLAGVESADLTEFDDAWDRCSRGVPDALLDYINLHEPEFIDWKQ